MRKTAQSAAMASPIPGPSEAGMIFADEANKYKWIRINCVASWNDFV